MTGIFGLINQNADDTFINTMGQMLVYDATQTYLERINQDTQMAMSTLVGETTEDYKERYKLPGGGRLQRRGGQARSGAVRAYGEWDVAYPLEDFGAQVASSDVDMAYMTAREYQRHVETVITQNINTMRYEMLQALFNNTQRTFVDPRKGSLSVEPLANGDSVVYPPVLGTESESTEDHYLASGYAAADISATNNPLETIRDELDEHFGESTGGDNIVVMINNAQRAKIEALAGVTQVPDQYIATGDDTDIPQGLPMVPGKVVGRGYGVWIVQWRWIPANYMFGVHLEAPAPLKMRVDPAATGLGRGLQLVAQDMDYPIESAEWRHRFGLGVANRLNGVAMELTADASYDIPAAYA